jgi:hypothetical protein
MIEKMIRCPVLGQEIDKGICFDCSMAVEGWGPSYTRMMMENANPDFKAICLNCGQHPQLNSSATPRR